MRVIMAWVVRNSRGDILGGTWDTCQPVLEQASAEIAARKRASLTVRFREGRALIYETPQDTEPFDHIRVEDEKGNEVAIPEQY